MAEENTKGRGDLKYGVVGEILYDQTSESWVSRRSLTNVSSCSSIQVLEKTCSIMVYSNDSYIGPESLEIEEKEKQIRRFIHRRPELAPAHSSLLERVHHEERRWRSIDLQRDWSNSGDLLAFATTVHRSGVCRIVAFPCSASGEEVAISIVRHRVRPWHNTSMFGKDFILTSEFGRGVGDTVCWPGDGGKVRQILFGTPLDDPKRPLLAVRSSTGLRVLNIIRHRSKVYSQYAKGSSVIELQSVGSPRIPNAERQELADICFSPWNQAYIAAITTVGTWCIWEVTVGQAVHLCRMDTKASGKTELSTSSAASEASRKKSPLTDGWYKINFLTSEHILVICTHFKIQPIDTRGGKLDYKPPNLGLDDPLCEILDVRASPASYNDLFLVTSTHIFWLTLNISESDSGVAKASLETLVSWRHYRDIMDKFLRLSVRGVSSSVFVVLHSVSTNVVTEYRFGDDDGPAGVPISLANPSIVELPVDIFTDSIPVQRERQILSLCFESVEYSSHIDGDESGVDMPLAVQYYQRGVIFLQIFIHFRDQSIETVLCYIEPVSKAPGYGTSLRKHAVQTPSPGVPYFFKDVKLASQLDLIVNDDSDASGIDLGADTSDSDQEEDENGLSRAHKALPWKRKLLDIMPKAVTTKDYHEGLIYSNRIVYDEVSKISRAKSMPFKEWATSLPQQLLNDGEEIVRNGGLPLCTLASLQDLETLRIGNTAENSVALSDLLRTEEIVSSGSDQSEGLSQLKFEILPMPDLCNLPRYKDVDSLVKLYELFVSCYVTPLPRGISSRARLAREKLVREFALAICLGSIGARVLSHEETRTNQADEMTQHLPSQASQTQSLGQRDLQLSDRSVHLSAPLTTNTNISSQLPLPSTTMLPASSQATTVAAVAEQSNSAESALQRLKAYATINPPVEIRDAPRNAVLDRVLAHWTVGSDPALYDYNQTVAELSGSTVIEGSAMSAEQQRKIRERAERQRLRAEQRTAKRARFEASQLLTSASQPVQNFSTASPAGRSKPGFAISASQPQPFERGRSKEAARDDGDNTAADARSSQATPTQSNRQGNMMASSQVSADDGFAESQRPSRATLLSARTMTDPQSQVEPGRFGGRRQAGAAPGRKRKAGF